MNTDKPMSVVVDYSCRRSDWLRTPTLPLPYPCSSAFIRVHPCSKVYFPRHSQLVFVIDRQRRVVGEPAPRVDIAAPRPRGDPRGRDLVVDPPAYVLRAGLAQVRPPRVALRAGVEDP